MVGGLGLAIALAAVSTIATANDSQAPLVRFLCLAICFSAPLVLTMRLVYGRWNLWVVRIALAGALLVFVLSMLVQSEQAGAALLFTALLALLLHPRVRASGPLVIGFFTIVIVGTAVRSK